MFSSSLKTPFGAGLLGLTLFASGASAQGLLITEVVDATQPGGLPKFVELTNTTGATIDLSGFSIGNYSNGGTTLGGGDSMVLSGMLAAGDSYVISYETGDAPGVGVFFDTYGFDPDNFDLGAFINGDDVLALFQADGTGPNGEATADGSDATLVDVYGVIGVDGSGEPWEYLDSWAFRCGDTPSATFDPMDWTFGGANVLDGADVPTIVAATSPGSFTSGCTPVCADDAFEPNEDCATAAPIGIGMTTGLNIDAGLLDWYTINVADGDMITVDLIFIDDDGDVDLRLEAPCGTFQDSSTSSSDNEQVTWFNNTGAAVDVGLRCNRFGVEFCTPYAFDITITTPPACLDDAFEPNDDCLTPSPITAGLFTGLNMDAGLRDYYSITLADGDAIEVNATFLDADGDIDIALYDAGNCDGFPSLASSTSSTDNESLSYTNTTGAAQDLILRGRRFGSEMCTSYDLEILISTPPACLDDDMGTNDACADADALSTGSTMATVLDTSDDWYTLTVADGQTVIIDALFATADGDMDIELYDDAGTCANEVDSGETTSDNEQVMYSNMTGADVDVSLRVFLFSGVCNPYELVVTVAETACLLATDDAEEDNDDCLSAVVPSANPLMGLFVSKSDMDYYGPFTLADMEEIDVLVAHIQADGDIDARIFDAADCTTILDSGTSVSDDEVLEYVNLTGASQDVIIQVELWAGDSSTDCNNYDLDVVITPFVDPCMVADDSFEENDDCTMAAPITAGSYPGLFGQKEAIDSDWYSIMVANGETLTVDVLHIQDNGDFDVDFFLDCVNPDVASGAGVSDVESVTWENTTGMAQTVLIHVFIWSGDGADCNDYDMDITVEGMEDFTSFCFGDGTGATCPCGNDSLTAGGGCLNTVGTGAVLTGSGTVSEAANDIMFNVSDATPFSFALLVSADNRLGGGLGVPGDPPSDGLRCVGGNMLRHGTRATDGLGNSLNPWGTGVGIIAQSGFTAGQTRHFQVRYRDDISIAQGGVSGVPVGGGCNTGSNTSQGVSVTFAP